MSGILYAYVKTMVRRQRLLYVSSKDRREGTLSRFCVDVSPLLFDFHAGRDNVNIEISVGQLYVPFERDSQGYAQRQPPVNPIPQIKMLRLHTDILHHNIDSANHTNVVLQIPFLEHYQEALEQTDSNRETAFSHVSFKEQGDQHAKFSLFHGSQGGYSCLHFWLTDEENRLIVPAADWYISLTLFYELDTQPEEKRFRENLLGTLNSILETNRLLLFQGEQLRSAQQDQVTDQAGAIEEDNA